MAHIDTSEIVRASLWLKPAGDALERIQKLARSLHKEGGGPLVPPHVTLLTGAETTRANAELKLKHLATRLRPFRLKLGKIESREEYFRAFYAVVEANGDLAAAQREAYDVFEMNPPPPYEPHLSLLYGKLDAAMKRKLADEAGGKLDIAFEVHTLYLVNSTQSVPVSDWHTLAEHELTGT
jgi:2'-5' RNA ligase